MHRRLRRSARRARWIAFAGLGVFASLAASAQAPGDHYEEALARFSRHEYEEAAIALKNALQRERDHLPALILLGRTYLRLGAGAAAQEVLEQARRQGADEALVVVPLGRAYIAQGRHDLVLSELNPGGRPDKLRAEILTLQGEAHLALDEPGLARKLFSEAMALDPLSAAPRLGLARIALMRGQPEIAAGYTRKAVLVDSEDDTAWHVDGEARRFSGDIERALESYARALSLNPRRVDTLVARAATLIDLGRTDEARRDLEAIREHEPEQPQAAYLQALVLARLGDVAGAERALSQSAASVSQLADAEAFRDSAPVLLLAGVVKNAQGELEDARRYLDRYLNFEPRNLEARRLLASVLVRLGDAPAAVDVLEPAVAVAPDDAMLHALLGAAYLRSGRKGEARKTLGRAVTLAPDEAALRVEFARSQLSAGHWQAAIEELEKALQNDPGLVPARVLLAQLKLANGDLDAALSAARELTASEPESVAARMLRGRVALAAGQLDEAEASFAEALELDPRHVPARYALAAVELRRGELGRAERHYELVLEQDSLAIPAMVGRARIAVAQDRLRDAVRWLEKARATDETAVEPQLELIELHLTHDQLGEALEAALRLETMASDDARAIEMLGRVQLARGERRDAIKQFERIPHVPSSGTDVLTRVAAAQLGLEDTHGARASLEAALARDPAHLPAEVALVVVEMREGRLDTALTRALRIRKGYANLAVGFGLSGDVLSAMGRHGEAAVAYLEGLEREPDSGLATKAFQSRWNEHRYDEALAWLEEWTAAHPQDLGARATLAGAYLSTDRLEAAERLHESLVAEGSVNADLLNNLAWMYQRRGDARALATAEKALELAPDDAGTLDTYGWILVESGRSAEGLQALRKAEARAAENPWVRYHIAVALHRLGRDDEARPVLRELLRSGHPFEGQSEAQALLESLSPG